jgi:nucleoside-diphosphate kinase
LYSLLFGGGGRGLKELLSAGFLLIKARIITLPETCMPVQRTFSIIKPDAVERGLTDQINAKFTERGLKIIAQKQIQFTTAQAEEFYAEHKERGFFRELVDYMTRSPIVVQILEGENAVALNREIMGATNPKEAAPGTIRKLFGVNIGENSVHGSANEADARREVLFATEKLGLKINEKVR